MKKALKNAPRNTFKKEKKQRKLITDHAENVKSLFYMIHCVVRRFEAIICEF